jgi:translocation and assembly module TamB
MRLSVSGNGRGDFDGKQLKLQGELRADRGYFEFGENRLPELGDDVHVVGQVKPAPKPRQARTPFEVDMQLDLGNQLEVHGYGLKGMLTGKVHLTTADKGELRAAGRIRAERASFTAYGQQLQVEQGLIIFDGPIDNPGLHIQAWRRNQAVAVGVQITGTVASPQVELVSEPPVPEGEKLSWLVLGRAPDNAQSGDIALLQAAAGTLFSRGDKVGINQKLAHGLGLDELTLRGSGALTGNVVALGKRLSDKIYITYEQGIGAAQNLVQLDYTLSRRWSARLETGTLSSIGMIYRIVFD